MINMEGLAFLRPSLRRILPGLQVETDYVKQYGDLHPVGWKMLAEQALPALLFHRLTFVNPCIVDQDNAWNRVHWAAI